LNHRKLLAIGYGTPLTVDIAFIVVIHSNPIELKSSIIILHIAPPMRNEHNAAKYSSR